MSTSIITAALSAQKSVVSDSKKLHPYSSLEDEDEGGGWANWWCGVKKGGGRGVMRGLTISLVTYRSRV